MKASLAVLLFAGLVGAAPEGLATLKIAPASREAGMGGAGVASGRGPQAMVWNPAATAALRGFAAHAGYCSWFVGTHQQSAFVVREVIGLRVGLGASVFSAGEFEWRNDVPSETPAGIFEPEDLTAYTNAALPIGSLAAFGATGRFYYSRVCSYVASGFGVDLGIRMEPLAGFVMGVSVTDFGTPLTYYREKVRLPTRGRLGIGWTRRLLGQRVEFAVDGSYYFNSSAMSVQAGGEVELAELVCLRGGCGISVGGVRPTLGLGLRWRRAGVDYSLEQLGHDLGVGQRISFSLGN